MTLAPREVTAAAAPRFLLYTPHTPRCARHAGLRHQVAPPEAIAKVELAAFRRFCNCLSRGLKTLYPLNTYMLIHSELPVNFETSTEYLIFLKIYVYDSAITSAGAGA